MVCYAADVRLMLIGRRIVVKIRTILTFIRIYNIYAVERASGAENN